MITLTRRRMLTGVGALSLAPRISFADNGPATARPEEMGFAADLGEKLDFGMRAGLLRNVHAVLVMRAGKLVLERYYEGADHNGIQPLGLVRFGAGTLHDLRSITKSVVSLLYGIALERGRVPPIDAPLYAQFSEYPDLAADPARQAILVEHALTMSIGLEWNELRVSYADPANNEVMRERSPEPLRFVLERPVVDPPGRRFSYNGGCTTLLGRLIERGTGKPLADFASETLFGPLGITSFTWRRSLDGTHSAAGGLRLRLRDLARFGELMLGRGQWNGQRLVPEAWIDASVTPALSTGDGLQYGRQWWMGETPVPAFTGAQRWYAGMGNGGQRLLVMPSAQLCCVIYAGNYSQPENWVPPNRIWREIVLANLQKA